MKKKYIIYFYLILFAYACRNEKTNNNHEALIIIDIDAAPIKDNIKLSNYFSKATIIPLELTDYSLINDVYGIQTTNDYIFVRTSVNRGTILVFEKNGRFVRQIGKTGNGPGEYLSVTDFTIDESNEEIYLIDPETKKINKYNYQTGNVLSSTPLIASGGKAFNIQYSDGCLYADMFFYDEGQKDKYMLQKIELNTGKQINTEFDLDIYNKNWNEIALKDESFFYSKNVKQPKYIRYLMDTILTIDQNKMTPFLAVKDKYWVTSEDVENLKGHSPHDFLLNQINNKKISYNISNFVEIGNLIYFKFLRSSESYYVIYDIKTKETVVTQDFLNDLIYKNPIMMEKIGCADQNGIYGYYTSDMIQLYGDFFNEKNFKSNVTGIEKLKNLGNDPNPIIIYYEYKK